MKFLILLAALALPAAAIAADEVALTSKVLVERVITVNGKTQIVQQDPKLVTPGEKIIFILAYQNKGKAAVSDFTVTNPIPASIEFVSIDSPDGVVSVDGGKSWGQLALLKVKANGIIRAARAADVNAVRWVLSKPIAIGAQGKLSFSGVVR